MSRSHLFLSLALALVAGSCASVPVPMGQQIGEPVDGQAIHTLSTVQTDPSVHGLEFGALMQPTAAEQESSVHGLSSLHWSCGPGLQTPPSH